MTRILPLLFLVVAAIACGGTVETDPPACVLAGPAGPDPEPCIEASPFVVLLDPSTDDAGDLIGTMSSCSVAGCPSGDVCTVTRADGVHVDGICQ